MGVHANWLAVRGVDKAELLEQLGWRECGFASDEMNPQFACAVLPDDWVVITSSAWKLDLKSLLPRASTMGFALACECSERVMYSRLQGWSQGSQAWSVTRDPEHDGVSVAGAPPPMLHDIRAGLEAMEKAGDGSVDYMFDAPIRLAKHLCGYEFAQMSELDWTVLCRRGDRPPSAPARKATLHDAMTAEIMPLVEGLGWRLRSQDGVGRGNFDVERIRDGRLQRLGFTWMDDGRDIYLIPGFFVRQGLSQTDTVVVSGGIQGAPERSGFGARVADLFGRGGRRNADERLAAVLEAGREHIRAIDAFLRVGEFDPRISLGCGSVEAWQALCGA